MRNACLSTPVLFLIFNRPDQTRRTLESIRAAKPKQLFVVADGPRARVDGEKELCERTRSIIKSVDWDCDLKVLYRTENLGCRKGLSSAITWFFENVEEGIILEDDCLAQLEFYQFCEELLEKYRDVSEIAMIGGSCFLPEASQGELKYYFSKCPKAWGWATWRKAWNNYDDAMSGLPELISSGEWRGIAEDLDVSYFWIRCFCQAPRLDTWAYRWNYSMLKNNKLVINPGVNLIENIGFGEGATHTITGESPKVVPAAARSILSLPEPASVVPHLHYDQLVFNHYYDVKFRSRTNFFLRWRKKMRRRYKTRKLMRDLLKNPEPSRS